MWVGTVELAINLILALVTLAATFRSRAAVLRMTGVLACFLIASIVTPPDPLSMLLVALPYSAGFLLLSSRWRSNAAGPFGPTCG